MTPNRNIVRVAGFSGLLVSSPVARTIFAHPAIATENEAAGTTQVSFLDKREANRLGDPVAKRAEPSELRSQAASLDGGLREAVVQQALDGLADLLRNPPKGVELPDELLDHNKKVADALDDSDPADIKDLDSGAAAGIPVF